MPEQSEDLDFSTIAIAHKVLSHDQVEAAQELLRQEALEGRPPRSLQDVLLEQGVLKEREIWAINKASERMRRDATNIRQRIGGYEILGKLGEGGLGVVYRARQLSMGRIVALKVLHDKWVGDDEFRKRFLVEARLVGRLSHQNLIQVYDVGRYKDTLHYAMEFVDGETVEDMIDREGVLPVEDGLEIIFHVARALQYLTSKNIVHRDVKPGNIMLTRGGVAKLGDFGFVKSSLDSVLSPDGEVLGTPDYISPEAALGEKDLDFRSDLYSLGASFYHMLTGKPPFGGTGSAVMEAHIREELPPPSTFNPDIHPKAEEVILRLMAKDPKDRYASFTEFFDDLEVLRIESLPEGAPQAGGSRVMRALRREQEQILALQEREEELRKRVLWLAYGLAGALAILAGISSYLIYLLSRGGGG